MTARRAPVIASPLRNHVTARLRLTRFVPDDAESLAPVFAAPEVWEFPFGRGMNAEWTSRFVAHAIEHWDSFGFGLWVVRTLAAPEPIGYLGLSMPSFLPELIPAQRMPAVEIGWRLHPGHWGNGYATEGARAALQEAFETLELREVCCAPQTINPRSARVAQRIGMSLERTATLPATDTRDTVEVDLYWISREQWSVAVPQEPLSRAAVPLDHNEHGPAELKVGRAADSTS